MVFPQKSWGEPNIFSTLYGLCILVRWPTLCAASKGADLGMRGVLSVLSVLMLLQKNQRHRSTRQYSALLFFSVCKTILWWGAISHISTRCYVFQQKNSVLPPSNYSRHIRNTFWVLAGNSFKIQINSRICSFRNIPHKQKMNLHHCQLNVSA